MESHLKEAFLDIIDGRVKRYVHELIYQNTDYTSLFINCLESRAYFPRQLKDIKIETGTRIPGFLIKNSVAYFGHLFWEIFDDRHKRKIWGSVIRNNKGDWKYILSGNSSNIIYMNVNKIQEVDVFHLT